MKSKDGVSIVVAGEDDEELVESIRRLVDETWSYGYETGYDDGKFRGLLVGGVGATVAIILTTFARAFFFG